MADKNPPKDTEISKLTVPDEAESVSPDELEQIFAQWDQRRTEFLGEDHDFGPPIDPDLLWDSSDKSPAQQKLDKTRRAVRTRLVLLIVLSVVGLVTLAFNWSDLKYFFVSEGERVDMGDIRERWKDGERPGDGTFPELTANSWIQFEGAITTVERESDSGTYFFFEPMFKAIVVTTRTLPEKNPRHVSIDSAMLDLIHEKWMYPVDVTSSFNGQGRLIRAEDAPRRLQPVVRLYRKELRLDTRLQDKTLWLIEDGLTPEKQSIYLIIYGVTVLLLGLSVWFYFRARRRHDDLLEDMITFSAPLP